jgi:hypothetical protein
MKNFVFQCCSTTTIDEKIKMRSFQEYCQLISLFEEDKLLEWNKTNSSSLSIYFLCLPTSCLFFHTFGSMIYLQNFIKSSILVQTMKSRINKKSPEKHHCFFNTCDVRNTLLQTSIYSIIWETSTHTKSFNNVIQNKSA